MRKTIHKIAVTILTMIIVCTPSIAFANDDLLLLLTASNCAPQSEGGATSKTSEKKTNMATNDFIDQFVQDHKDAYIKSWGVGGFLPTVSINQTFHEVSFNENVPSFGKAHNMGGVKSFGNLKEQYAKTIELYGADAVSNTGGGTDVGDNTGGSYTYFKNYDAGIVGKAEFLMRNSRYTKVVNNTNGEEASRQIARAGWATASNYEEKLVSTYAQFKEKYGWLDEEAIKQYGETPVNKDNPDSDKKTSSNASSDTDSQDCQTDSEATSTTISALGKLKLTPDGNFVDYKNMPEFQGYNTIQPDSSGYPKFQCTNWAYLRSKSLGYVDKYKGDWAHNGNGRYWVDSVVTKFGFKNTKNVSAGDILSYPPGVDGAAKTYGHVAMVEEVKPDGSVVTSQGGDGFLYQGQSYPKIITYSSAVFAQLVSQGLQIAHPA